MQVLILGLNYLPESTSIGPYTADLAEHLSGAGHQVQVITGFPVAPYFKIWEGYRGRRFMRETINGIPVLRTWLYVPARPGRAANRVAFDMSFAVSAMLGGIISGPVDVIIAISPPLQIALTALALAGIKHAKVFLQIKDLVPDAAIAAGMLAAQGRAAKFGYALERLICSKVDRIGVICEGFKTNLTGKGIAADKIDIVPDYIDLDFMRQVERLNPFRREHRIGDKEFVATYSGSIAMKQGLRVFVEAAAQMVHEPELRFLLIGDGPYLPELRTAASDLAADNLTFMPLQSREQLPFQLGAADALVITQRKAVSDCVFPGKLLYYMAAGRPIIAAVSSDSETGKFINRHRVGIVTAPEDPPAFAQGVSALRANIELAHELGCNGRAVAERVFERKQVLTRFEGVLRELHSRP
ncbi:MAG: WcaI family glycosyltransferase [Candidatus Binataceae bacterium]